ncbi:MAG: hypothetical protein IT442_05305, partial [Phycisphaeraceae bacterium]|nr:hypothetical protein [Phycisphaeraceae bacterium]
ILSELKRHFGDKLLPVVVHFNIKLNEAASFGQAITEYDPGSRGMQDFERLTEWLMANPCEAPEAPEPATVGSPALSRAAELVERARALSRRTAALAAKLQADADIQAEPSVRAPQPPTPVAEPAPAGGNGDGTILAPMAQEVPATPPLSLSEKLAKVYGVRATTQGLLFVQPVDSKTRAVAVAGDFNAWSQTATPLVRDEQLGVWQVCVPVPPGRYRYRLIVDGQWVHDPYNHYVESNPFGELDSVVEAVVTA